MSEVSVYDQLGGADAVRRLVQRFYELMGTLPEVAHIRDMHPQDMARSEDSLFKFLSGWFGGPPLFEQERGHPRLRMRHAPFAISPQARDEWMLCMRQALSEQVTDERLLAGLEQAFAGMANHLVNSDNPTASTQ